MNFKNDLWKKPRNQQNEIKTFKNEWNVNVTKWQTIHIEKHIKAKVKQINLFEFKKKYVSKV